MVRFLYCFSLFLLPQVPSLLFFFISVTVPEVHKSRSVSANMLLVTQLLEQNITLAVHFDFVQPVFSSETPPWQTKIPLLKKKPTRLILNYTTKHLPVNSDILTYILGKKYWPR